MFTKNFISNHSCDNILCIMADVRRPWFSSYSSLTASNTDFDDITSAAVKAKALAAVKVFSESN